jgi:hypothetical protein
MPVMTRRDWEVMRTMGRFRVLRVQSLVGKMFKGARAGQRRFRVLRDAGLIERHRQAIEPGRGADNAVYYRLSRAGMRRVLEEERGEVDGDAVERALARTRRMKLKNDEHQEALLDLYLEAVLVRGDDDATAKRAEAIRFWGDRAFVMKSPLRKSLVIPDAVYLSEGTRRLVMVEMDRSTASLRRIEEKLTQYSIVVRTGGLKRSLPQAERRALLFVTRTAARAKNIRNAARLLEFGPLEVVIRPFDEAVRWLDGALYSGEETAASHFALEDPELKECLNQNLVALGDVYLTLSNLINAAKTAGHFVRTPETMTQAHEVLTRYGYKYSGESR